MAGQELRQPRTLDEVLRLAVTNTDTESPSSGTAREELSGEDRAWLAAALSDGVAGMASQSPSARLNMIVRTIQHGYLRTPQSPSSADSEEEARLTKENVLSLMEEAIEWSEDIDVAIDFIRNGGVPFIESLLKCADDGDLRRCGGELAAATCQNNPVAQEACTPLLPLLLERVDNDSSDQTRVKAQYAVSCIVRGCAAAEEVFLQNDGLSVLLRAMSCDVKNLRLKATFLLIGLCRETATIRESLTQMGMVEELAGLLSPDRYGDNDNEANPAESCAVDDEFREHVAGALLALLTDCSAAQEEASDPRIHLMDILEQRLKCLGDDQIEEKDTLVQCRTLLVSAASSSGIGGEVEEGSAER